MGGAPRRALAAFRLGSILGLERIGLVLSMTMTDQHVVQPDPTGDPTSEECKEVMICPTTRLGLR
jgi:hypothetical protein